MTDQAVRLFQETVWHYYAKHGRHDLPWRLPELDGSFDPYKILVSEVMLQQTQVPRVIPKFQSFIAQFPSFADLAMAPLAAVLRSWNGLGYNRRAKFLWEAARQVTQKHDGYLPKTAAELVTLPGVGANTAGAILAYAYNQPVVFLETNIRTVFIHHFFADQEQVSDKNIAELIRKTLPNSGLERAVPIPAQPEDGFIPPGVMRKSRQRLSHYRNWYWALMDYGTYLKQTAGNASRRSLGYTKQSKFAGSQRQIRGQVLRLLGEAPQTKAQLVKQISDVRLLKVLADLKREGIIEQKATLFRLPDDVL